MAEASLEGVHPEELGLARLQTPLGLLEVAEAEGFLVLLPLLLPLPLGLLEVAAAVVSVEPAAPHMETMHLLHSVPLYNRLYLAELLHPLQEGFRVWLSARVMRVRLALDRAAALALLLLSSAKSSRRMFDFNSVLELLTR